MPPADRLVADLVASGYERREVAACGLTADSRWPGRIVGAWRDERGDIATLWARATGLVGSGGARYLNLRGGARTELPPYGLGDLARTQRQHMLLVEGVLDVHHLRARGIPSVAAIAGSTVRSDFFERLTDAGIESVTLCLDNDAAGRAGTARAIDQLVRAEKSPDVYVIDPRRLGEAKDVDELLRHAGLDHWRDVSRQRLCAIEWRASELLGTIKSDSSQLERRRSLAAAGAWLGRLPTRLSLEQDAAIASVAQRTGHDPRATRRAFRARFWQETRTTSPSKAPDHSPAR